MELPNLKSKLSLLKKIVTLKALPDGSFSQLLSDESTILLERVLCGIPTYSLLILIPNPKNSIIQIR